MALNLSSLFQTELVAFFFFYSSCGFAFRHARAVYGKDVKTKKELQILQYVDEKKDFHNPERCERRKGVHTAWMWPVLPCRRGRFPERSKMGQVLERRTLQSAERGEKTVSVSLHCLPLLQCLPIVYSPEL